MNDLEEASKILEMIISININKNILCQKNYIIKILETFNMIDVKSNSLPIENGHNVDNKF